MLAGSCRAAGARAAQVAIARQVGCQAEEIAITRSGCEALRMLIVNHKGIKPGDAVVYCDLDYPEMICAMEWLGDHRGAQLVKFAMLDHGRLFWRWRCSRTLPTDCYWRRPLGISLETAV